MTVYSCAYRSLCNLYLPSLLLSASRLACLLENSPLDISHGNPNSTYTPNIDQEMRQIAETRFPTGYRKSLEAQCVRYIQAPFMQDNLVGPRSLELGGRQAHENCSAKKPKKKHIKQVDERSRTQ